MAWFCVGLALQVAALPVRGTYDVSTFRRWASFALTKGVPNAYSRTPVTPGGIAHPPDYPPLTVYILSGVMRVATVIDPAPGFETRAFSIGLKALIVLLRVIVVALVVFLARRATSDPGLARSVALAYWLNPALILNGPVLGYLDPLCWIPGLFAIVAAALGFAGTAGVLAALSLLIKPQGVFFLLPVAAILWRSRDFGFPRAALNGGLVCLLSVLPFLLSTPAGFMRSLRVNLTEDLLSGDAMNVWWLINGVGVLATHGWSAMEGRMPTLPLSVFSEFVGFNPRPFAAAFVIAVALWAFWHVRSRRDFALSAAMAAFVVHAYFVFAINVHENHLVYAIPLVGLAALTDARYWRLYVGLSAFVLMNLLVFYGLGRDFTSMDRTGWFWPLTLFGSVAGIALLGYHFRLFRTLLDERRAATAGRRQTSPQTAATP